MTLGSLFDGIGGWLLAARHAVATIYGAKSYSEYEAGKVAALRASGGNYGGGSENLALSYSIVRRLPPTECERLQGLEDG